MTIYLGVGLLGPLSVAPRHAYGARRESFRAGLDHVKVLINRKRNATLPKISNEQWGRQLQ